MDLNFQKNRRTPHWSQRCPFCHDAVEQLPTNTQCETCSAWHHSDCWDAHKKCASCGHGEKAPTQVVEPSEASRIPQKQCMHGRCEGLAMNDARFPKFASLCKAHGYALWKAKYESKLQNHPAIPAVLCACFIFAWFGTQKNPFALGCSVFFGLAALLFHFEDRAAPWPTAAKKTGHFRIKQGSGQEHKYDTQGCEGCGDPFDPVRETEVCKTCRETHHVECKRALQVCPGCNPGGSAWRKSLEISLQAAMKNPPKRPSHCENPGCVEVVIPWDGRSIRIDKCLEHSEELRSGVIKGCDQLVQLLPLLTIASVSLAYFTTPKPARASIFLTIAAGVFWGFLVFVKRFYKSPSNNEF